MSETYTINFTNYEDSPYFLYTTATAGSITFYSTNTNQNHS